MSNNNRLKWKYYNTKPGRSSEQIAIAPDVTSPEQLISEYLVFIKLGGFRLRIPFIAVVLLYHISSVRYLSLDDYSFCYCNRGAQLHIISPQILPPWRLQMDLWSYRNSPLHSIDICCRLFQMKISVADTPTVMYTSNKSHHLDWWHCISQTARIACWQLGPRGIEHARIGDNLPRSKIRPRIRNDADEV